MNLSDLLLGKNRDLFLTDRNGIITHFLIANFLDIFDYDPLEAKLGFGNPENTTIPAKLYNPAYVKKNNIY